MPSLPSSHLKGCRCLLKAGKSWLPLELPLHIHPRGDGPSLPGAGIRLVQAAGLHVVRAARRWILAELLQVQVQQPHLALHLSLHLPQILPGFFQKAIVPRHRAAKCIGAAAKAACTCQGEKLPRAVSEVSV